MEDLAGFTFTDRHFFEPLSCFPVSAEYPDLLKELIPRDWRVGRFDVWLSAHPPAASMPDQGFKIHVSTQTRNAAETMRRVIPECVRAETSFKVAADPLLLRFLNSKRAGRGSGAKFMTIYPRTQAAFQELIEAIHRATSDLEGPYILSDQRYRDSRSVFYRYGGFRSIRTVLVDGRHSTVIAGPGGEFVPDERLPYFQLPDWVRDPLAPSSAAAEEGGLLHDRYDVQEALAFSNSGGVYRAVDTATGQMVVIKEARPHIDAWVGREFAVNAVKVLHREHNVLRRLQHLSWVPDVVELFHEWEHTFLVIGFVEGEPLAQYRARDDIILIPYMHVPERVSQFSVLLRTVALQLIDAVEAVHRVGVVLGDLSPNNVLINPDTLELRLIDFESARIEDQPDELEEFSTQWFTQGFRRAQAHAATLDPADDYFAVGRILFNLLLPVQTMFDFEPAAGERFLGAFAEAGLPPQVRRIIELLMECRADEAKGVIESWNPAA